MIDDAELHDGVASLRHPNDPAGAPHEHGGAAPYAPDTPLAAVSPDSLAALERAFLTAIAVGFGEHADEGELIRCENDSSDDAGAGAGDHARPGALRAPDRPSASPFEHGGMAPYDPNLPLNAPSPATCTCFGVASCLGDRWAALCAADTQDCGPLTCTCVRQP